MQELGSEIIFNGNGVAVNLNGKWIQFEPQNLVNSPIQSEKSVYDNTESEEEVAAFVKKVSVDSIEAVSYTHLTLPTIA